MAQQNVSLHGQRMIPGSISWRTLRKKLISEILRIQRQVNGLWLPCLLWMQTLPFSLYNRIPTSNTLNYLSEPNSNFRSCKIWHQHIPNIVGLVLWTAKKKKKKKQEFKCIYNKKILALFKPGFTSQCFPTLLIYETGRNISKRKKRLRGLI